MNGQPHPGSAFPIALQSVGPRRLTDTMLVIAAIVLLTISAKIQIPLWPVPITMQTYVVIVVAMGYGTRLGATAIAGYIAAGLLGLPVFAGTPAVGAGLAYLAGPTGGYLLGFLVAGVICGALAGQGWTRRFDLCMLAAVLGHALILACGVAWLAASIGVDNALRVGLVPFLWGTAMKAAFAAVTLVGGDRLLRRKR